MVKNYDFIIIGGGTAGCVLANRLSANPNHKVLVLEAGGKDHWWDFRIHMPAALSLPMGNPKLDWCYETEPEPYLDGRHLAHARGKVLGGSSSINGMIFQRGNPLDYTQWTAAPGMDAWSYAHCLPYFKRAEAHMNTLREARTGDTKQRSKFRGQLGPLNVERGACKGQLYNTFFQAAQEAGYAVVPDLNGYQQEGFAPFDRTIYQGLRQSAARCYLHPILHRKNLDLLCKVHVTQLIMDGKRATGVCIKRGRHSERYYGKNIIVSAGTFNSPALLQRSGIGAAAVLAQAGVKQVHELPGVGENLQDHLEVYVQQRCTQPISQQGLTSKLRQPFFGLQWIATQKGVGATNHFEAGGFIRSTPNAASPDIMIHFLPLAVRYDGTAPIEGHGFQLHIGPTLSNARGRVWIKSDDYRQAPAFVFNYLSTEQDRQQWVAAIRAARRLLAQPSWGDILGEEISPGPSVDSADSSAILNWIKSEAETALHPAGTCKLGVDAQAVVDPQGFNVHGLTGLYIVDASLMPTITNANLSAPVYMMAERAADALLGNTPLGPENTPFFQRQTSEQGVEKSEEKAAPVLEDALS